MNTNTGMDEKIRTSNIGLLFSLWSFFNIGIKLNINITPNPIWE
jgi:hypothetical protein